jgi:hypothetical protein
MEQIFYNTTAVREDIVHGPNRIPVDHCKIPHSETINEIIKSKTMTSTT